MLELIFRLASQDADLFARVPDLTSFFNRLFEFFMKKDLADQSEEEEEFLEPSKDSEILALLLLRLARNEKCRNALVSHPEFDSIVLFLMQNFHILDLSEAEMYSYTLGLVSLASTATDIQRCSSFFFLLLSSRLFDSLLLLLQNCLHHF